VRTVWTIARREFAAYFVSPIAYVVAAILLFVLGLRFNFLQLPLQAEYASPKYFVDDMSFVSFLVVPALTMRLLAEERRSRTLELLMSAPVREGEVVAGKYLAGLGFYLVLVLLGSIYPLILFLFGNPDPRALWTGYLGILLFGGALVAVGTLGSSLTQNQIVAFIVSFGMLAVLWVVDLPAELVDPRVGELLRSISITGHLEGFGQGIVDTRHVVYYLSVIALALFLATRALEGRRQSG